jgi:hypothetical protein
MTHTIARLLKCAGCLHGGWHASRTLGGRVEHVRWSYVVAVSMGGPHLL